MDRGGHTAAAGPRSRGRLAGALALLLVVCFGIHGRPVPAENEFIYLLLPIRQWNADFLANDWTFSHPWYTHLVFNLVAGWMPLVFRLETAGWIGRFACWIASLGALLVLGRRFALGPLAAAAAIALFMLSGQSIIGGSWMIGTFEAKCVAYVLLILALDAFAGGRVRRGAIALGLAFSFHSHVGLMGGIGVAAGLLARRTPVRELAVGVGLAILFALPGGLPLLQVLGGGGSAPPEAVRFLAEAKLAVHLDPQTWPRREILLYFTLFAFNALQAWPARRDPALRFLLAFEAALALVFVLGLALRAADAWRILQLTMPFRLGPLVTLLFFGFHLLRAAQRLPELAKRPVALAVCALALLGLPNPLARAVDYVTNTRAAWREQPDDLAHALAWLRRHTPEDAVVLSPPTRHDAWYLSRRAQVVTWIAPTAWSLGDWHGRVSALAGDAADDTVPARYKQVLDRAFHERSEVEIVALAERYGADYLVSKGRYGLPVLFACGEARVYAVSKAE